MTKKDLKKYTALVDAAGITGEKELALRLVEHMYNLHKQRVKEAVNKDVTFGEITTDPTTVKEALGVLSKVDFKNANVQFADPTGTDPYMGITEVSTEIDVEKVRNTPIEEGVDIVKQLTEVLVAELAQALQKDIDKAEATGEPYTLHIGSLAYSITMISEAQFKPQMMLRARYLIS